MAGIASHLQNIQFPYFSFSSESNALLIIIVSQTLQKTNFLLLVCYEVPFKSEFSL